MSDEAVFVPDGEQFVPGPDAIGPWAADRLHGGPVLGLIARAVEQAEPDPELVLARLSVDMFRPVPAVPLGVRVESLRKGSRLALLRVRVFSGDVECAQGTALLLRTSGPAAEPVAPPQSAGATPLLATAMPPGPEGLPTESLMRQDQSVSQWPKGFHTRVETRWVRGPIEQPVAIWFRLPIPLVAGEPAAALVSAVALSDFANAVPSIAASMRRASATPYINADATIYLTRRPVGEWFCLQEAAQHESRGISSVQVQLFDQHGALGHASQARLAVR